MRRGESQETFSPEVTIERRDRPNITKSERRAVDFIELQIHEGKTEHVGSGRSSSVEMLTEEALENATGIVPWVIKRETTRTEEQELLEIDMEQEMQLQEIAFQIIEDAKRDNPNRFFAQIPRSISRLSSNENENWLIMEYVPGDTLMERTLKEFVFFFTKDDPNMPKEEEIQTMKKEELFDLVSEPPFVFMLPPRFREELLSSGPELDERVFLPLALWVNGKTKGSSKILSQEQYQAVVNTIEALNGSDFFHRDLHASNFILIPDGRVAIIDFGLSVHKPNDKRYTVEGRGKNNTKTIRLLPDMEVIEDLQKIARKIK